MSGQWMKTIVENQKATYSGSAATGSGTITVDLPKANFIGHLHVRLATTGTGTVAQTVSKIEVVGNGSHVIKSYSGAQLRALSKFDLANLPASTAGGTTDSDDFLIMFGRFIGDELCMLPAKIFKTLQLKITWSATGTTVVSQLLDVICDEYVSDDDPLEKLILKDTEIEAKATGTGVTNFDLPLGNLYRRLMLIVGDATSLADLTLKVNNGASRPYAALFSNLLSENFQDYELGATYTDTVLIDLDRDDSLRKCLDSAGMNDLKLEVNRGATTTTATLIASEVVRLK